LSDFAVGSSLISLILVVKSTEESPKNSGTPGEKNNKKVWE